MPISLLTHEMQPVALLLQMGGLSDYDPNVTAGGVNAPPVKMAESILLLTDDRTVTLLTERADPGIAGATVKDAVAVHIKLLHTDGKIKIPTL
jgi:hypothetical protein